VQCEILLAATFIICWTLNLHWFLLLVSSKKFTSRDHWITGLSQINGCYSSQCLSCPKKAVHKWAIWRLQSANVCEAAPNTQLKQLLAGEKYICPLAKIVKSLHHYVRSQWKRFWVYIYAHCSSMRSQMLYTRGSFEICQERMFVKQRRKHRWSSYLLVALTELRKNIIMHIVPRKTRKVKVRMKFCLHKKTRQNFTCTWPEHSAIVSSWTLKCNASAVVVVAENMWISQNMLWLPCSNRMSRF